jgi:hypothetical protein
MSQNQQFNPEQIRDASCSTLFQKLHSQVFFNKLASFGIVPSSEEEAVQLLQVADQLRQATSSTKSASAFAEPLQALSSLNNPESEVDKMAGVLFQDEDIYNSVLNLFALEGGN